MVFRHVWIAPVIAVASALIGMFSGYIIGAAKIHFPPLIPFISDGGALVPEACIFAQFLNLSAFFYVINAYIRHRQIVDFYEHRMRWKRSRWYYASLISMLIGFTSALGLSLVGNFRENEIGVVHNIGAFLTFFGMVFYGWGQLIIGFALVPRMTSMVMTFIRGIIMVASTVLVILHFVATFSTVFLPQEVVDFPDWEVPYWYTKDSPFYRTYIIATSSEWVTTLLLLLYTLTFVEEYWCSYATPPRIIFKHNSVGSADFYE